MTAKRALVFVASDRVGGAEKILKTFALEALDRGYAVDVVCWTAGPKPLFTQIARPALSVTILAGSREWRGALNGVAHFSKICRRYRYSIVFSSHVHCSGYLALLRLVGLLRTDHLICRESTVIARRFRGLRLAFYRFCYLLYIINVDKVVCQTNDMKKALKKFAPWLPDSRLIVVPNPVSKTSTLSRKPRSPLPPVIVSVGRLIYEKGYHTLIEAFVLLRQKYSDARLHIYGDGPLRPALASLVEARQICDAVNLEGFTDHPLSVMQAASVCVVSSIQEGFPNTLLEMMMVNTRVVSTLCAEGIEAIKGLEVCDPGDARSLMLAIERALEKPDSGRAEEFDAELAKRSPRFFFQAVTGEA